MIVKRITGYDGRDNPAAALVSVPVSHHEVAARVARAYAEAIGWHSVDVSPVGAGIPAGHITSLPTPEVTKALDAAYDHARIAVGIRERASARDDARRD